MTTSNDPPVNVGRGGWFRELSRPGAQLRTRSRAPCAAAGRHVSDWKTPAGSVIMRHVDQRCFSANIAEIRPQIFVVEADRRAAVLRGSCHRANDESRDL